MIEYDAETNRYTVTLMLGKETCITSFDRDRIIYGEREGLEYLIEGIQNSIDHAMCYGEL